MSNLNLIESLVENNSIQVNKEANNWEEAIKVTLKPLVDSNCIKEEYIQNVIKQTNKYGPYYIISDQIAMPHARPEDGALKNAFSIVTLKKPITFLGDNRKIKTLIGFAATSNEIHVSNALPQIVALAENKDVISKIENAQNKEEIIKLIKTINLNKYLG